MNTTYFVIGIVVLLAFLAAFFGFIGGASKPFASSPKTHSSDALKAQASAASDETRTKERKLMDELKQKMEDSKHKN